VGAAALSCVPDMLDIEAVGTGSFVEKESMFNKKNVQLFIMLLNKGKRWT
jgi:hypothetical protein